VKAVLQDMQSGGLTVADVPPPALQPGGILVRVRRSLISLGTERAVIALAKKGPIGKAQDRPDLARKVLNRARQEGFWDTYQVVKNLVSSPIPLGYSCAGEVIDVGAGAGEFRVGDLVACAGLNFANHAEIDFIPRNLAVKLPEGASFDGAAFVAVGAIAVQGVRLARLELGETVLVMGLGLVGQLTLQLCRAAGARVIGFDPDPVKCALARELGADAVFQSASAARAGVAALTDQAGADAVLIAAASKSDAPARLAVDLSRLRGRVVIVGDVGMRLDRRALFEKEVSVVVSRSYGPGRYDPEYELHGTDYPLPYVRWTERRNMLSYLELVARGAVRVDPLITHRYPIDRAEEAYRLVEDKTATPIGILLEYRGEAPIASRVALPRGAARQGSSTLDVGLIGIGQFAKGILLPALVKNDGVRIRAACSVTGLTSRHVANRYGAEYCTSEPEEVLADPAIRAVVIATRHDQHAALTEAALAAGKAVFVEKPLAIREPELERLATVLAADRAPALLVGFNRRFAPLAVAAKRFFEPRTNPLAITYRVNAGRLPQDSWILDPRIGGGRIVGEVCHFVDLFCFLTDAVPTRIAAEATAAPGHRPSDPDAVSITLTMSDGSTGMIQYLTNGDPGLAKEYMEVSSGGRTAVLENFRRLTCYRDNRRSRQRIWTQAKGHREELAAFVAAARDGSPMPIDPATLVAVTQTTFLIQRSIEAGAALRYYPPGTTPA
jgi:predicted dehydrogenase/threonine dehydrogenase-like Zn-dependent dehydrogenase